MRHTLGKFAKSYYKSIENWFEEYFLGPKCFPIILKNTQGPVSRKYPKNCCLCLGAKLVTSFILLDKGSKILPWLSSKVDITEEYSQPRTLVLIDCSDFRYKCYSNRSEITTDMTLTKFIFADQVNINKYLK